MSDEAADQVASTSGGEIEILSDTKKIDFGPWLFALKLRVQHRWHALMPDIAKPPTLKSGDMVVSFGVMRDGRVEGLRIERASGNVALDRAAYGAITYSSPFNELPLAFAGKYLLLRVTFHYNPKREESPAHKSEQKPSATGDAKTRQTR